MRIYKFPYRYMIIIKIYSNINSYKIIYKVLLLDKNVLYLWLLNKM